VEQEFEAQAQPLGEGGEAGLVAAEPVRPLPDHTRSTDLALSNEVRTVALAAAGGVMAGAATVAVVRAARSGTGRRRPSRRARKRERAVNVLASRSFLVDVHLLDR
jgi:hypothetical protein